MKGSNHFKLTIQAYLEEQAANDPLFAPLYKREGKNMDDCITYILNQVLKSGCNGFIDDEIYSLAIHYFTEDNIGTGAPINCKVVVNHVVELTEEEKEEVRKKAIQRIHNEAYNEMKRQPKRKVIQKQTEVPNQLTLF